MYLSLFVTTMRFTLLLLGISLLPSRVLGQADGQSTLAARQAISRYDQANSTPERLYDGPEYVSYDRRLTGHAFFLTDSLQAGRITYDRVMYAIPLLYETVKDLVVVVHTSGYRLALHSDRVQSFSMGDRSFIRLDSAAQTIPAGFYERLYNGRTQLLARHTKSIQVHPTHFSYGQYDPKTVYYVRKNGRYWPVKNRRAFLALLPDQRRALQTYVRQQKLRFRPSPEAAFVQLITYYDTLNGSL